MNSRYRFFDLLGKLLTADRLLKRIHQVDGIRAKLRGVVIERLRPEP